MRRCLCNVARDRNQPYAVPLSFCDPLGTFGFTADKFVEQSASFGDRCDQLCPTRGLDGYGFVARNVATIMSTFALLDRLWHRSSDQLHYFISSFCVSLLAALVINADRLSDLSAGMAKSWIAATPAAQLHDRHPRRALSPGIAGICRSRAVSDVARPRHEDGIARRAALTDDLDVADRGGGNSW